VGWWSSAGKAQHVLAGERVQQQWLLALLVLGLACLLPTVACHHDHYCCAATLLLCCWLSLYVTFGVFSCSHIVLGLVYVPWAMRCKRVLRQFC
jgi:hypothetical protein